jgi:hypothetical protein
MNIETGEVVGLKEQLTFAANLVEGSFAQPYVLSFGEVVNTEITDVSALVYPNPFKDHLTITLPDAAVAHELIITDLTGKVVKKMTVPAGVTNAEWRKEDHHALRSGVYLLEIKGGKNRWTIKLVKN